MQELLNKDFKKYSFKPVTQIFKKMKVFFENLTDFVTET